MTEKELLMAFVRRQYHLGFLFTNAPEAVYAPVIDDFLSSAEARLAAADDVAEAYQLELQDAAVRTRELEAANARAEAEKERADRAERSYESAALQLCKDWQERKDYLFDTETRAEKAEAEAARLKPVVDAVIAYFDAKNPHETECWVALSDAVREYRKAAALQDADGIDAG